VRPGLFWDVMQHRVVFLYGQFGTICWSHFHGGLMGCPKMSVQNYHSVLHNTLEECISHLHCSRSLKSRISRYSRLSCDVTYFGRILLILWTNLLLPHSRKRMEAGGSFKILENFYHTTRCYIPDYSQDCFV
jgi:hypothetical protein